MTEILIDTNFIVNCMKQKVNMMEQFTELFGDYTLRVPRQVFEELERLESGEKLKIKDREAASISIQLFKANKIIPTELMTKEVDAGIIRYTKQNKDVYVATLDKILKNKIKEKNKSAKFLTIRQKTRIAIQ